MGMVEAPRDIGSQVSVERRYFLCSFNDLDHFAGVVQEQVQQDFRAQMPINRCLRIMRRPHVIVAGAPGRTERDIDDAFAGNCAAMAQQLPKVRVEGVLETCSAHA